MTLEALTAAVTREQGASLSFSALATVTMAQRVWPPGSSISTSVLTAPGRTALTVPVN